MNKCCCLLIICAVAFSNCEIHRARGIKPKSPSKLLTPRSTWPPGPQKLTENENEIPATSCTDDESQSLETSDGFFGYFKNINHHSIVVWTYAIISAMLVGLSGIFPLLIIPLDAGENLKHGRKYQ